jgi:hypothetical protein
VRLRVFQRELGLDDFSGGLNLRDAPTELANNESPDLWNVTLDERGGIQKRLGYVKKNSSPYVTSAVPQQLYEWQLNGTVFTQCGADLFKDDGTGTVHTFSTVARAGFAEFGTEVFVIHPVDGLYRSGDGTTWTHVPGAPAGSVIEPWQNRLLALGDPGNVDTLYASAIADARNWSTTDADRSGSDMAVTNASSTVTSATAAFVASDVSKKVTIAGVDYHIASVTNATTAVLDATYAGSTATGVAWSISGFGWTNKIREHDSKPLVAMKAASGLDIAGKPGVLVFKADSTYRINDSNTGAYQTLDTTVGAASSVAVTNLYNETFVIHPSGIYQTNGVSPLTLASAKVQPLFTSQEVAYDKTSLWCAGFKGDRVHFSLPRAGSTHNDLHLEYHPAQGWIVGGSDAASCYINYRNNTEKLYGGAPAVNGQVYELNADIGSDDGADISCWYQTKWIAPGGGINTRFRRLRVFARGTVNLYVKRDFDTGTGDENQVVLPGGAVWNQSDWNQVVWGPARYVDTQDFWSLGVGEYISFRLEETSSNVCYVGAPFGMGQPRLIGAFALYGLTLQYILVGL